MERNPTGEACRKEGGGSTASPLGLASLVGRGGAMPTRQQGWVTPC